jgi:putative SOS response-associated peptidase YedK
MCGRFTLRTPVAVVARQFELSSVPELQPRYNIAPRQPVAVVRINAAGERELAFLSWGLVPAWADDPAVGYKMINARGETVASKPSFKQAFRSRRCLVPADGFYEWQKAGPQKQAYHITLASGELFAIAGLWERWQRGDSMLETCTLLTTSANEDLQHVHDRMPVIVPPESYAAWLDPGSAVAALTSLIRPLPPGLLALRPVSSFVNNPAHEGPECLQA